MIRNLIYPLYPANCGDFDPILFSPKNVFNFLLEYRCSDSSMKVSKKPELHSSFSTRREESLRDEVELFLEKAMNSSRQDQYLEAEKLYLRCDRNILCH